VPLLQSIDQAIDAEPGILHPAAEPHFAQRTADDRDISFADGHHALGAAERAR